MTGYIDVDAIVDSINQARIYQFVIKPFDRHDFELTVQRAVEAYERKRELKDYVQNLESKVEQRTYSCNKKIRSCKRPTPSSKSLVLPMR